MTTLFTLPVHVYPNVGSHKLSGQDSYFWLRNEIPTVCRCSCFLIVCRLTSRFRIVVFHPGRTGNSKSISLIHKPSLCFTCTLQKEKYTSSIYSALREMHEIHFHASNQDGTTNLGCENNLQLLCQCFFIEDLLGSVFFFMRGPKNSEKGSCWCKGML